MPQGSSSMARSAPMLDAPTTVTPLFIAATISRCHTGEVP